MFPPLRTSPPRTRPKPPPGYPDYALRPGGTDITVDAASLPDYLAAVVDATLGAGIAAQMEAFRGGFTEVVPLSTLDAFYEDELEVSRWFWLFYSTSVINHQ
jgi:hypothetical protein